MAGYGTGYPSHFACSKAREIYYGWRSREGSAVDDGRTSRERRSHVVTLTGRTKPTKRTGKGHPRKSWTTYEYRCACGHVGWSSHIDLEKMAEKEQAM